MRVVLAGTPAVALPSLEALLSSEHDVIAVLTRPDAPAGRGRRASRAPVAVRAEQAGIEVLAPARPSEPAFLSRLRALAPDCCPVVAYGALLRQETLDVPRLGWVNLHFSLLPAWRGAAPVQHAVLHGDEITGATTFRLVAAMDAGPVLGTLTEAVRPTDTAGDLLDRLSVAGADLLVATLDGLEAGAVQPVEQPVEGVSYAPRIEVDDARVRWSDPAFAVDRRVRACTPSPGAWTTLSGDRLKLGPVTLRPDAEALPPGSVHVARTEVLVGTGTVPVALGEVRAAGRRPMPGTDWARGARLPAEVVLGG
ncbi:MAG TPA: methionyl-tRNA formyltransferase [Nocardioidaceae bacterium]|nr:methionyl-tRNA formyltransferase [Nocardioidaceae bacterium]